MYSESESELLAPLEKIAIKDEFEKCLIQFQCRTCLSIGRKLQPLGEYTGIYRKITADFEAPTLTEDVEICWECHRLLQKVELFRQRIEKTNLLFQNGQDQLYGTLSTLTMVVLNESHPYTVYVNEQTYTYIQKDTVKGEAEAEASNPVETQQSQIEQEFEVIQDFAPKKLKSFRKLEVPAKEILKKPKGKLSRWAERRRLENLQPKYKVVTKDTERFRRVQYDFHQLKKEFGVRDTFKCGECLVGFVMEEDFLEHNAMLHGENRRKRTLYICDICSGYFYRKCDLIDDVKHHEYCYFCEVCNYRSACEEGMKSHFNICHEQCLQCLKCGVKCSNGREFNKHHKKYHEIFICDYCGVSFKMKYCIIEHIKKQHSTFECSLCDARFSRYNGLWLHKKTRHTRSPAPRAYCVECDKEYVDIYRYRWHLANSVKHRPNRAKKKRYPCPDCDKVFTKKIYMKDHFNFVHLKHFRYQCSQCGKNFVRNPDLVKHQRRVHEGILPPKNKICYMCGRGFSTNKILVNHVRTHTGERPFACEQCPAKFAQSTALRAHSRALHLGVG